MIAIQTCIDAARKDDRLFAKETAEEAEKELDGLIYELNQTREAYQRELSNASYLIGQKYSLQAELDNCRKILEYYASTPAGYPAVEWLEKHPK
jgi:hypothetical protein